MFYAISSSQGLHLFFVKNDVNSKSPDVFLYDIPVEVKTIIDKIEFQTKIERDLHTEVLGSIRRSKIIQDINDGLAQNAKIIALNATTQSLGYALDKYVTSNEVDVNIKDAMDNCLNLANMGSKDFVPVLVYAACIDYKGKYRMSAFTVRCPSKNEFGKQVVDISKIPN